MSTHLLDNEVEADIVRHARVLPLDVVEAKGNGHAGTAVGLTPLLTTLFNRHLRHDPANPDWAGRDRFILSCGHTSLSLYLQLYLSGYGLEMEDLRAARRLGSLTPGHPERGVTRGVEMSTGPLGQGIASAVGAAMEERRVREMLTPDGEHDPFGHRVWCLVSDGDMFEGISSEAAALAGAAGLPGLTVLWDDNRISIEGATSLATREDVAARFAACGWRVLTIEDAEDIAQIDRVLTEASSPEAGDTRPTFIRVRTRIGHPMPHVGGTSAAHAGAVGPAEIRETKQALGLDPEVSFAMPPELLAESRRAARERGELLHSAWTEGFERWAAAHPEGKALYDRLRTGRLPKGWEDALPEFEGGDIATRVASGKILASLGEILPELWGGSCDLGGSTSTTLPTAKPFTPEHAGRQVFFGIREHAQAAALTGMSLSGLTRAYGSTYLTFSDYQRPALRLASLMGVPSLFLWTHDSLAVGEDGPTHQPVEHMAALRSIPGFQAVRPADAWETRAAWHRIISERSRPVGLVLSRQNLPVLTHYRETIEEGTARGGYVLADFPALAQHNGGTATDAPRVILLATGSEVAVALQARELLGERGVAARVVSLPCFEWFQEQDADYRESVLPGSVRARVSVEAGIAAPWGAYIGLDGASVSVEDFGQSGDGAAQMTAAGFTAGHVAEVAESIL